MSQLGGSVPGTKKYKKEKKGLPSVTKKQKESDEKKAWLKKTRNSPAARSGAFSDDERWALQQKHRASQAARKKKKAAPKKDTTPNKTKLKTPAQAYTAANKNKKVPKHRKNSKKSWLDRAWGR